MATAHHPRCITWLQQHRAGRAPQAPLPHPQHARPQRRKLLAPAPSPTQPPQRLLVRTRAAADTLPAQLGGSLDRLVTRLFGPTLAPGFVTACYVVGWFGLHMVYNLQNKAILNWFPYPWFIATVHVVVGSAYCGLLYLCGATKLSFERPIDRKELGDIMGPALFHAAGHIASNLSFAAVALSLTHTVKTLEPAFSAGLSLLILGQGTPLPALACLAPIMLGVAAASAAEVTFNWAGFGWAMLSNLVFGLRACLGKKAMGNVRLGSTGIYAYTTLISVFICAPGVLLFEGGVWEAAQQAVATLGPAYFYGSLLSVGLLYHLYNQFAFNTLARISPVSHGVCNVVNRVVVIVSSVLVFGNELTLQTKLGTALTLLGTLAYSEAIRASRDKGAAAGSGAAPARLAVAPAAAQKRAQ